MRYTKESNKNHQLTIRYLFDEQWKTIVITLKQTYILYFGNNIKWTIGYVYTEANYKYMKTKANIFEVITKNNHRFVLKQNSNITKVYNNHKI